MKVLWSGDLYQKPDYCCEALAKFSESDMMNYQPQGIFLEQKPDKVYRVLHVKGKRWGLGAFLATLGLVIGSWIVFVSVTDSYYWAKDWHTILNESRLERPSTLLWLFQDLNIHYEPTMLHIILLDVSLLVLGLLTMVMISYSKPKVQELVDKKNPGKAHRTWGLMSHCPFCGEAIEVRHGERRPFVEKVLEEEAEIVTVEAGELEGLRRDAEELSG